ncbi:hypothetical protein Hypma_006872 [Hypsizygus marmoreus]|uniref:ThuA-like domain-containing protein n=1 Tax=Hypsizygus marmoreus TaxID=39966 RepID=A0A369JUY8_HYPMA|nr:hypothetical protein Hypma_006872 [Hypsizygus marmoreus]
MFSPLFLCLLGLFAVSSFGQSVPARILIYSATEEFRHDSIPTAITVLKAKGASINVEFDSTEDKTRFTDTVLQSYDAILFLSNTGEVLDNDGKDAFQRYLILGGNFIAVHSASDCLLNTSFYGREVGAYFDYHADLQDATVDVLDDSHPSTSMLPAAWSVRDEMYNFKSDPRTIGAVVVLAANESSYVDSGTRKFDQGTPHPLAWYQTQGAGVQAGDKSVAGRSFYTSLGHLNETWQDTLFMSHILGGVSWTLEGNTTRSRNASAFVGNTGSSNPSQASSSPSQASSSPSQASLSPSQTSTTTAQTSTTTPQISRGFLHPIAGAAVTVMTLAVGCVQLFPCF